MTESKSSLFASDRVWYDQFTSTDWVHDTIADSHRAKALRSRKDIWGRIRVMLDGVQGWILSALSGFVIALVAYVVNVSESTAFDFKDGYCTRQWYLSEKVRGCDGLTCLEAALANLYLRNAALTDRVRTSKAGQRHFTTIRLEIRGLNSPYIWCWPSPLRASRVGSR